mmetsp:Transcript_20879/g.49535  ORF Transcript_20879/g.49535 Transcript_20879/m.49535 type:complete len:272 (+) Transcript_20879:43-858(+)|eukprot:CAMPEP_0117006832 /NCGR_PEP_ID=MMETSP0472-20121206/6928_1 /TAXON_ID=693140 ORGANISM="Tiarina fusus, Strain LIS" /NCGR_SAMPLE_ID=MMETSP0472 /ASSEMBLY_ACC=CAM_ASM_000603 /LENGTH=271 /DNA_ID=CAMNT_0004708427 /DNA_START=38 /DNA_END=853 /DNA_ORIENTATION=-
MYPSECAEQPGGLILVTPTGEFFMALCFLVLAVCTGIFALMGHKHPWEKRSFFLITAFVTLATGLSYFAMLGGQGWIIAPNCRQVFFAKYMAWGVSASLVVVDLAFIAGVPLDLMWSSVGFTLAMAFTNWMASVSEGNVKWMWFVFTLGAMSTVLGLIFSKFRMSADLHHVSVSELFGKLSWLTLICWCLYPFVWVIGTGSNVVTPNFETMLIMVLDICSYGVFGFVLLMSHEALDRSSNSYGYRNLGDPQDLPPEPEYQRSVRESTVVMT